ncbi:MAG: hypothetical protein J6Y28_06250 [Acholeplasmatales bacterium]|nr:hypothetical protein [Acholeplasmatales bacterium]
MKTTKRVLLVLSCFATSVLLLAGCKDKTTKKSGTTATNTTSNVTTNKTTTNKVTTKKVTTQKVTTEAKDEGAKVTEQTFKSYFGIDDFSKVSNANYTLEIIRTDKDDNSDVTTVTSKVKGKEILNSGIGFISGDEAYTYEEYYIFEKNTDDTYGSDYGYNYNGTGWNFSGPTASSETLKGLLCAFYLPTLDYSKVSFNETKNAYVSTETIEYAYWGGADITDYTNTITNVVAEFEDGILKKVSFDLHEVGECSMSGETDYTYTVTINVSNVGTTTFETPVEEK